MSRIGKKPIVLPDGVTVTVTGFDVVVKGAKGELKRRVHSDMGLHIESNVVTVVPVRTTKKTPALWGLTRSLVANMVEGVAKGYSKRLEFEGIGYKVVLDGPNLTLQLGFSHPVHFPAPPGIHFTVEKNAIVVSGIDKEMVGETAARIRALKPAEPYKGKGIRYQGEIVRRKAGKKAVASA